MKAEWNHKIFNVTEAGFDALALEIFRFQYANNELYHAFADAVGCPPGKVDCMGKIPFLPVRFFKSHRVVTTLFEPIAVFESSGTTGIVNSHHYVKDLAMYEESFLKGFERAYGPVSDWCIVGLLPSYVERKGSSLVYMVEKLISLSHHVRSGFYLNDYEQLIAVLLELETSKQKTLLVGVTFALLDLTEKINMPLQYTVILETGGMKGRRREMIRNEVHDQLKKAFSAEVIHSEYGMTELLSQAYSKGNGIFNCPPWMKIILRDDEDPFLLKRQGSGTINVIDLANIWSCSFLATDDAGRIRPDGSFEVLGRIDGSDLRGCSLLTV
jgi:phenylacetate-coenzyme A ligase PaaK-like adenylate-forming protein